MVAIPDRDSPDQANTRYGQFFADLHIPCARSLHNTRIKEGTPGTRRTGINLGFREHHLRVEVRSTHAAPPDGAMLLVEQVLPGDVSLDGEVVGGADYVLVAPGTQTHSPLTSVVATCEVKGPTRAAFLDPAHFKHNWGRVALIDFKKQVLRARAAPAAEHHMAFLIPFNETHVLERIDLAFRPASAAGATERNDEA